MTFSPLGSPNDPMEAGAICFFNRTKKPLAAITLSFVVKSEGYMGA